MSAGDGQVLRAAIDKQCARVAQSAGECSTPVMAPNNWIERGAAAAMTARHCSDVVWQAVRRMLTLGCSVDGGSRMSHKPHYRGLCCRGVETVRLRYASGAVECASGPPTDSSDQIAVCDIQ